MVPDPKELGNIIEKGLIEKGIFKHMQDHVPDLEDGRTTSGYGYPITGLEKFLGYFDQSINIANFPSISIVTDFSVTHSVCKYTKRDGEDEVWLDGKQDKKYTEKARRALQFFKSIYEISGSFKFYIERKKKYENAKGLGESASVAASVARALIENVFGKDALRDVTLVSRFARMVSGSGTRSVSGGLSIWLSYPYMEESHSAGYFIRDTNDFHVGAFPMPSMLVTDSAHKLAKASDFYGRWVSSKYHHILEELDSGFDTDYLLTRAQEEMYTLNSIILSQGHFIQTPSSLDIINSLVGFTAKNEGLYYTADTGPSIVLLSKDKKLVEEFVASREEEFIWSSSSVSESKPQKSFLERSVNFLK